MPLALETHVTTEDTPEVAALKKKVREVAKVYTDRHGWCDVINQALREIGVEEVREIVTVQIDFTLAGSAQQTLTKDVYVDTIRDMSDEEHKAWFSGKISPTVKVGGAVDVTIPATVVDLTLITDDNRPDIKGGWIHPDFVHRVKQEGQDTIHLVTHSDVRTIARERSIEFPRNYANVMPEHMEGADRALRDRGSLYMVCSEYLTNMRLGDDAPPPEEGETKTGIFGKKKAPGVPTLCEGCVANAERRENEERENSRRAKRDYVLG